MEQAFRVRTDESAAQRMAKSGVRGRSRARLVVYRGVVFSRARALRWALVWALVLAVVGMHHLSAQDGSHPMASASVMAVDECCPLSATTEHAPKQDGEHDMLHLCLAILAAALVLALTLLVLRTGLNTERFQAFAALAARLRAPPPRPRGAPALLANLCVLRL